MTGERLRLLAASLNAVTYLLVEADCWIMPGPGEVDASGGGKCGWGLGVKARICE